MFLDCYKYISVHTRGGNWILPSPCIISLRFSDRVETVKTLFYAKQTTCTQQYESVLRISTNIVPGTPWEHHRWIRLTWNENVRHGGCGIGDWTWQVQVSIEFSGVRAEPHRHRPYLQLLGWPITCEWAYIFLHFLYLWIRHYYLGLGLKLNVRSEFRSPSSAQQTRILRFRG